MMRNTLPPLRFNDLFGGVHRRNINFRRPKKPQPSASLLSTDGVSTSPLSGLYEPPDEGFDRIRGRLATAFTACIREHDGAEVAGWLNDRDCIERAGASGVDTGGCPVELLHAPAPRSGGGWGYRRSMEGFGGRRLQQQSIATLQGGQG